MSKKVIKAYKDAEKAFNHIPLFYLVPEAQRAGVLESAKRVGLTRIEDQGYTLHKLGAKTKSNMGYPDAFKVMSGKVAIVGVDNLVWIAIFGIRGEWFKTSPIVKVRKVKDGFKIETENSFYKLVKVNNGL